MRTNYLIVGSGVAGLTLAIKIAERYSERTITIVTKAHEAESNTKYAQGGVATVWDLKGDSFQKHIQDTLKAGDGLCDKEIVEMVVKEGPHRLKELIKWGAQFDLNENGKLDLGKEGGHSEYRVIHHKDITGSEIERVLLQRTHQLPNITILPYHFALDLITKHHLKNSEAKNNVCYGAYVMDEKSRKVSAIISGNTILASGGIGVVYGHTTNPRIATGDGIAMAYRAKAKIMDMEFIQFHPTLLYNPKKKNTSFLISEAVRGFGAYLRTKNGYRFMPGYHKNAELASRDIVSQSMDNELKKNGDPCVYLDCTHLDMDTFVNHFPNIYNECLKNCIDLEKEWIPVVPAAHYLCGGIAVDKHGRTSITNLHACGESSRTGLHGANRLASNSLLEALVYADKIYTYFKDNNNQLLITKVPKWNDVGLNSSEEQSFIQDNLEKLQCLMKEDVGIVRSNENLMTALSRLEVIYQEVEVFYKNHKLSTPLCELRNMVNVAHLIIQQSLQRKENRGGYFNIDWWQKKLLFHNFIFYFLFFILDSNCSINSIEIATSSKTLAIIK